MANFSNLDKSAGKLAVCLAAIGAEGEVVVDAGAEDRLDLWAARAKVATSRRPTKAPSRTSDQAGIAPLFEHSVTPVPAARRPPTLPAARTRLCRLLRTEPGDARP